MFSRPTNTQVLDYIDKLVDMFPGGLVNILNTELIGIKIAAGGAFIHQKLLAHFTQKPAIKI